MLGITTGRGELFSLYRAGCRGVSIGRREFLDQPPPFPPLKIDHWQLESSLCNAADKNAAYCPVTSVVGPGVQCNYGMRYQKHPRPLRNNSSRSWEGWLRSIRWRRPRGDIAPPCRWLYVASVLTIVIPAFGQLASPTHMHQHYFSL